MVLYRHEHCKGALLRQPLQLPNSVTVTVTLLRNAVMVTLPMALARMDRQGYHSKDALKGAPVREFSRYKKKEKIRGYALQKEEKNKTFDRKIRGK